MPYLFIEDENYDSETMGAPADVVERSELDAVIAERDEVRAERDAAAVSIETLTGELADLRDKYTRHIISGATVVKRAEEDAKKDSRPQSFEELFKLRERG